MNSAPALSVKEINDNFPEEIISAVEERFYHASCEFRKLKKHQAKLKAKRGHGCPWANKLAEDAWVRRVRKQWAEQVPKRSSTRGRPGYGFHPHFKLWLYASWFHAEQNAEDIYSGLNTSADYAQLCGLTMLEAGPPARFELPSARTLRHFNQVMYTFGLWGDLSRILVLYNLEQGTFPWSEILVVDPTHLDSFGSVGRTCQDCKRCRKRRSCQLQQTTCELTGIVSKSKNYKLPGVKLNLAVLPESEIAIAAVAYRGQAHDKKLFRPLLTRLAQDYPELREHVQKILADGAHDDPDCHKTASELLGAQLETALNPGARKPILAPARGIQKIDPDGVPICTANHAMSLAGRDMKREHFLWVCPVWHPQHGNANLQCSPVCRKRCAPDAEFGRALRVPRTVTPQINWENPQHLSRVGKRYRRRTKVERTISRCKRVLKFERFFNRGRRPLQAHGDRYVCAVQLVALVAYRLDRPEATRRYRLTAWPQTPSRQRKNLSKNRSRISRLHRRTPTSLRGPT